MKLNFRIILALLLFNSVFAWGEKINYQRFIDMAYKNNPSLQMALKELESAELDLKKAKGNYLPTIDFTSSFTFLENTGDPIYLNTSDFADLYPGLPTNTVDKIKIMDAPESTYYDFGLRLQQPIFTWGKLSIGKNIALELTEFNTIEINNIKRNIEIEVKSIFLSLYTLIELKESLNKQLEFSNTLSEITKQNYENGFIEYSDFLRVEYLVLDVSQGLDEIDYQISNSLNTLKKIGNMDSLEILDLDLISPETILTKLDVEDINTKLNLNPNIQKMEKLLSIKNLEVDLAKASKNLLPDLALIIDTKYNGSRFPLVETDWYRKNDYDLNFTIAISTTLFNGGISSTNIKQKEKQLEVTNYQISEVRNSLLEKINGELIKIEHSKKKLIILNKREELSLNTLDLSRIKFKQGLILESSLLEDEIAYQGDRIKKLREKLNYDLSVVMVNGLLGD